jgi:hypothetical protein
LFDNKIPHKKLLFLPEKNASFALDGKVTVDDPGTIQFGDVVYWRNLQKEGVVACLSSLILELVRVRFQSAARGKHLPTYRIEI